MLLHLTYLPTSGRARSGQLDVVRSLARYTTKSEGLVLLLFGYLSFISEILARVRD